MSSNDNWTPSEGGCPCKNIRYRLERSPLIVHCCHCRWCQKETGSAFALNIMIETQYTKLLSEDEPMIVDVPSESGLGQRMARCKKCQFVIWSNYGDTSDMIRFVRAGTLDDPSKTPPNVHIFTASKQPWVVLNDDLPAFEEFYVREKTWSKESFQRREELLKTLKN